MTSPKTYVALGGQTVDGSLALEDRTFRDAWQLDGDAITVDMVAARDIQRSAIRAAREPRLLELDAEWFLASEAEDAVEKARVAGEKQALRDATEDPRIDAAATPEALKALTLDALLS